MLPLNIQNLYVEMKEKEVVKERNVRNVNICASKISDFDELNQQCF